MAPTGQELAPSLGFQSLSRDSGRLNQFPRSAALLRRTVSIPQSGFGAFELLRAQMSDHPGMSFQSLSRDSGRLNILLMLPFGPVVSSFNPSVGIRGV